MKFKKGATLGVRKKWENGGTIMSKAKSELIKFDLCVGEFCCTKIG